MSKNSKNSVKEPAEERTPAPQPKALNQTAIDPMYIGRLAGTLLGICLVTALLLGAAGPWRALWRRSPPPGARDLSTWWWAWTPPAR